MLQRNGDAALELGTLLRKALNDNAVTIDPAIVLNQSTGGTPVASQSITNEKLIGKR